jgi:hypothetical protein
MFRTVTLVSTNVAGTIHVLFQERRQVEDKKREMCSLRVSEVVQEVADLMTLWMHYDSSFVRKFEDYMSGKSW